MHIVIADQLPSSAVELLRSVAGWTIDARSGAPATNSRAIWPTPTRSSSAARPKSTAALMAAAPQLRVIARAGTGVDNVDVPAATERGIVVMNAPGANSISVAELALALMLSLARAVPAADAVDEARRLGQEEADRRRASRQDARHRRSRPHRPGSRRARPLVRHGHRRARSVHLRAGRAARSASSCSRSTTCARAPTTSASTSRRRRRPVTCSTRERLANARQVSAS